MQHVSGRWEYVQNVPGKIYRKRKLIEMDLEETRCEGVAD
jgi:hypothetical protein